MCYVAGRSGGHIVPLITLAYQSRYTHDALFVVTHAALDQQIMRDHSFVKNIATLPLTPVPYRKPWLMPWCMINFIRSCICAFILLRTHKPERVITTGGYSAVPICIAALLMHIPYDLYELNVEPGRTIKLLAPGADKVYVIHAQTQNLLRHSTVTPYPLRYTQEDKNYNVAQVRTQLGLVPDRYTIFVIGGSQGSLFLNTIIKQFCEEISSQAHPTTQGPQADPTHRADQLQIIHQTGPAYIQGWQQFYEQRGIPAVVIGFTANLLPPYQAADLVITRAGAGTLAELAFLEKRSIIIPLETNVTRHQWHNAQAASQQYPHLFTVLRQKDIEQDHQVLFTLLAHSLKLPRAQDWSDHRPDIRNVNQ